ncbi:MAG: DUF1648 domain-containing protein [Candidatus Saccharimonadales bacterium]
MRKNNIITMVASTIICLLPMIAGAILYSHLPEEMPVHFNLQNVPDVYGPKWIMLFGIPVIMTLLQLLVCGVFWLVGRHKTAKPPKLATIMLWIVPILTITLYFIMIKYTLSSINVGKSVCFVLGIIFAVIGNYFPKMTYADSKHLMHPRPKNEKSFRRMTKISGYSFIIFGAVLMILAIFI